ncbi:MAG: S-layer homology domain-containing protein [Clostridiales bacterium]|nr:S-layer homology domain-containing protein [Clostridiales bacterium]
MKKVLAIVLALAMILGSFSFVAASSSDYSDVAGTKYEGAVAVLGALDVVSGYPDGTFKPEKVVTRAEMCKLIITALSLDDYVTGSYAAYPDVAGSHWATSYIAYATSLGIITGYPDGTFRPENPVTYQEAAAMLVRALGYQDQYLVGAWPASHVNVAMSEGILKGVVATAAGANRGDIALMVYNTLTCSMVQYNALGTLISAGDMLERMGAVKVEAAIFDQIDAHDALKNFGLDLSAFVGEKVDYYWINVDKDYSAGAPVYDATKGDAPVVVAKEYGAMLTGEYKAAVGTKPATFVVGDTEYKFNADPNGAAVEDFYNGVKTANSVTVADKGVYTINAKLNGVYIDEVYTTAQWVADAELKWTEDDADILAADDKIASIGFKMTKTDAIDYSWLQLVGVEDLATIAKDSIVTVYADSADAYITKIGVSTDTANGKITKVAGAPGKEAYTIGDAAYKLSKNPVDSYAPALGNEGTYFLNYKGELSAYKADSYAGNYAIVLDVVTEKTTYGSAGVWQLYLMTKDGEKAVYDFNKAEYAQTVQAGLAVKDLITFKTNADGKIVEITEVTPIAASTLTDKGILNGMLIEDAAVIFDIKAAKQKDWNMGALANLKTGNDFNGTGVAFYTNNLGKVDVIVITTADNTKAVSNLGIITGNYQTYNAKNEPIYGGTVLVNGAVVDFVSVDQTISLAKDTIFSLKYKADAIETTTAATGVAAAAPMKEGAFAVGEHYAYFNGGYTVKALSGDFDHLIKVVKKAEGTVDLGDGTTAAYQYIGAASNFYKLNIKVKADNSGYEFDKVSVGTSSDVKKGAYIMPLQLDKKSGAWDTIVYVTADDAAKLGW